MKTKKELISIVKSIEIQSIDESFYRFGCNYLFGMKKRGITGTAEFFELLKYSENRPYTVHRHFGVSGKNNDDNIKRWCSLMLRMRNSYFAGLGIDELRQLFGYCSYEAKVKKDLQKNNTIK